MPEPSADPAPDGAVRRTPPGNPAGAKEPQAPPEPKRRIFFGRLWMLAGLLLAVGLPLTVSELSRMRPGAGPDRAEAPSATPDATWDRSETDPELRATFTLLGWGLFAALLLGLVCSAGLVLRKGFLPGTAPGDPSEDRLWPRRRTAFAGLWVVGLAFSFGALGPSLGGLVEAIWNLPPGGWWLDGVLLPFVTVMWPAGVALSAWGSQAGRLPGTAAGDEAEDRIWPVRRVVFACVWAAGICAGLGGVTGCAYALATGIAGMAANSLWLAVPEALVIPAIPPAAAALAVWGSAAGRLPGARPPAA